MSTVAEQIEAARSRINNLGPEEFARQAEEGVVIDLREAHELTASGVLPGALHIPRGMLEFNADPATPYYNTALRQDQPVLLYCASGGRSALAAAALKDLGYQTVGHLDGGIRAWLESGQPVDPVDAG